jgi:hypothetical protein
MANQGNSRKFWVAGGALAVIGVVGMIALDYPPASEDASGTIVPAKRFRADGGGATILGDSTATQSGVNIANGVNGAAGAARRAGRSAPLGRGVWRCGARCAAARCGGCAGCARGAAGGGRAAGARQVRLVRAVAQRRCAARGAAVPVARCCGAPVAAGGVRRCRAGAAARVGAAGAAGGGAAGAARAPLGCCGRVRRLVRRSAAVRRARRGVLRGRRCRCAGRPTVVPLHSAGLT